MYHLTNTTVKRVLPYRVFPIFDTRRFEKKTEKKVFDKKKYEKPVKKEFFCKIEEPNIN
jgi:hypothetical protein